MNKNGWAQKDKNLDNLGKNVFIGKKRNSSKKNFQQKFSDSERVDDKNEKGFKIVFSDEKEVELENEKEKKIIHLKKGKFFFNYSEAEGKNSSNKNLDENFNSDYQKFEMERNHNSKSDSLRIENKNKNFNNKKDSLHVMTQKEEIKNDIVNFQITQNKNNTRNEKAKSDSQKDSKAKSDISILVDKNRKEKESSDINEISNSNNFKSKFNHDENSEEKISADKKISISKEDQNQNQIQNEKQILNSNSNNSTSTHPKNKTSQSHNFLFTKDFIKLPKDKFTQSDTQDNPITSVTHHKSSLQSEIDKGNFYPWISKNSKRLKGMTKLHQEIIDFYEFIRPTPEEDQKRHNTVKVIKNLIQSQWPDWTVKEFGSFPNKIHLPDSDVDILVLTDKETNFDQNKILKKITQKLVEANIVDYIQLINARVPIIKATLKETKINLDIRYVMNIYYCIWSGNDLCLCL
jgi:predicted nucleotidyltransferase